MAAPGVGTMRGMRILVTGGTGFVWAHAVAALLARGHQVRLLARIRATNVRGTELVLGAACPQGLDPVVLDPVA